MANRNTREIADRKRRETGTEQWQVDGVHEKYWILIQPKIAATK